jgi:hypothetical protein
MTRQPDEALEVLRGIWSAQGQTSADLDDLDDAGHTKACKRMADVGFDGLAMKGAGEAGGDVRSAWRDRLEREGKLNPEAGSVRDLVLGQSQARD